MTERLAALVLLLPLIGRTAVDGAASRRSALQRAALGGVSLAGLWRREAAAMWQLWTPDDMLYYVRKYGAENDVDSVLAAMDKAAETSWMMNMGPEKGRILEDAMRERRPRRVLELGTFCGYSTARMVRELGALPSAGGEPPEQPAELVTVEKDRKTFEVAQEVLRKCGYLGGGRGDGAVKLKMVLGDSSETLQGMSRSQGTFDLVLMDHWKEIYLKDLQLLEKKRLLSPDAVLLFDNVRLPGAPRLMDYLFYGDGAKRYESRLVAVPFEYRPESPDAMIVTRWRGKAERAAPLQAPACPDEEAEVEKMADELSRTYCDARQHAANDGSGVASTQ